jgi:hypothetical protein
MPVCQQCRVDMTLDRIIPCAADYDMWSWICPACSSVFSMVEPQTADRTLVDERRVVLRHAVTTPATIAAGQREIACTVHNLSASGASLVIARAFRDRIDDRRVAAVLPAVTRGNRSASRSIRW